MRGGDLRAQVGAEVPPVSQQIQGDPNTQDPTGDSSIIDQENPENQENPETVTEGTKTPEEELVYINIEDGDIRDIVKQISKATGRNFILDDKLRGRKLTILSERPMTQAEAYQTFLSALNVAGFSVVEGPGGVFKVVSLNEAKKYPIPTHVDTIPISDSFVTRLVTLRNVGAADMMRAIRDMLSRGGTISVYPQTNTLIITDSGTNINRLMKIMKELDQEGPQQVMEIMPVRNASAKEVAAMINQLFEQQRKNQNKPKAGEPVDLDEVSQLIPDDRTNSIIVLASKRAMDQVRTLVGKLDRKLSVGAEGRVHVYYLKYAKSKDLAATLSTLTAGTNSQQAAKPGQPPTNPLAEFEGGIKIAADESINALIITASPKDYNSLVDRVISKLDVRRRQVYLEAVVMELRSNKSSSVGVSMHGGAGGNMLGFGQTFGAARGLGGALGADPTQAPALLGGLISQSTVNVRVFNGTGFESVEIPAFSAFLNAIASNGNVNIVSTPNLLTLDNEEAEIKVESEEPIPGQTSITGTGIATQNSVDFRKAGLTLKITPQIGYGDMINLKIEQELSTFNTAQRPELQAPATITRKVSTNVLSQDGQTIVIGGLMEDQANDTKRKIPILGDIPLLGFLFSQQDKQLSKSNLLLFITPHIVKDSTDFSNILERKISERNRFIEQNYGKKQQEFIRSTIRTHREDLLEFKQAMDEQAVEIDSNNNATTKSRQPVIDMPKNSTPPQADRGGYAPSNQPIITAPPIQNGKNVGSGVITSESSLSYPLKPMATTKKLPPPPLIRSVPQSATRNIAPSKALPQTAPTWVPKNTSPIEPSTSETTKSVPVTPKYKSTLPKGYTDLPETSTRTITPTTKTAPSKSITQPKTKKFRRPGGPTTPVPTPPEYKKKQKTATSKAPIISAQPAPESSRAPQTNTKKNKKDVITITPIPKTTIRPGDKPLSPSY